MRLRIVTAYLFIIMFSPAISSYAAPSLPEFFKGLYAEHRDELSQRYGKSLDKILRQFEIGKDTGIVRGKLLPLFFYHALFTSSDAIDCARGGILEIPYFWHWVDPNPRYDLIYVPDGKPLNKTRPPKGFEKYKSYADIDRTPAIYLQNLVADQPLFRHPSCGEITTFGWCSEREMAFANLMTILGYQVKIIQSGIHVWSEVLLEILAERQKGYAVCAVDNTFNTVRCERLSKPLSRWSRDFGDGAQVAWYNKKALSEAELTAVRNIVVTAGAEERIEGMVTQWLKNK